MTELDPEVREIRLAVVMTGGVSLAVWIGGVAGEIHRAGRGEGIYGALERQTRSQVVVDVITGASAGGINGAFLAAATVYGLDAAQFEQLRNVWRVNGGFENLLRTPGERNPASLLRGDQYFLAELERELGNWVPAGPRTSSIAEDAVRLVMTTTTLRPDERRFRDDLGATIVEPVHRGQFTFTGTHFDQSDHLAAKLALAARASASFPGAFEPAFVPVGTTWARVGYPTLPDMAGIASFEDSRWVVDGGVLVNKPVGPALDAIKERSANRELRRVLLYVNPDPGDVVSSSTADDTATMPTMAEVVVKSLVTLPRTESVAADLASITAHNRRLIQQRDTRTALLLGLRVRDSGTPTDALAVGPWRVDVVDLVATARPLYPIWLRQRAYRAVSARLELLGGRDPSGSVGAARYTWEEFADALRFARGDEAWLASEFPDVGPHDDGSLSPGDPTEPTVLAASREWRFGLEPLEYLASVVLNLVGRAYTLLPVAPPDGTSMSVAYGLREMLGAVRERVHRQRRLIALLRDVDTCFWRAELMRTPWPDEPIVERAEAILSTWPLPSTGWPVGSERPRAERERWGRLAALLVAGQAARPDGWEAATDAVLDLPPPAGPLVVDDIEAPLGAPEPGRPRAAALAYRRAEMAIARHLAQLLLDAAPLFYDASDHDPAMTGWRDAVAAGWAAAPPAGRLDRWNHPDVPGLDDWLQAKVIDFAPFRPGAYLSAEVMRLTMVPPVASDFSPTARTWDALLQQVLALYIVHTMADAGVDDREVRIDFVQVSADAPAPLAPSGGARDKVAGLQLGHFGGFLKESWRANDWMWGALDGANHLVRVLVEPARLKQRYDGAAAAAEALISIARGIDPESGEPFEPLTEDDRAFLAAAVPADDMRDELTKVWAGAVRAELPITHNVLARTAQLLVARRELVAVGEGIRASGDARTDESPEASRFLGLLLPYLPASVSDAPSEPSATVPPIPLARVEGLVRRCPVGRERVADEYGSDRFTATAAQAVAVTGNLLAGNRVGTGLLRRPMQAARYGLRGLYYLAASALSDTKTEAAFRNMLLAIAGVIVAIAVFGVDVPSVFVVAAVVSLGGWFVLSARSVQGLKGVLAAVPVLLVLGLAAVMTIRQGAVKDVFTDAGQARWRGPVLAVGLLVAAVAVVVELVRAALARRVAHAVHAGVWVVTAVAWWGVWFVLFHGPYSGPRRWIVDRLEDVHRIRLVLLVAIPAGLLGYDLLRVWLSSSERARRRRAALSVAARHHDELEAVRARLRTAEEMVTDLRHGPPGGGNGADAPQAAPASAGDGRRGAH